MNESSFDFINKQQARPDRKTRVAYSSCITPVYISAEQNKPRTILFEEFHITIITSEPTNIFSLLQNSSGEPMVTGLVSLTYSTRCSCLGKYRSRHFVLLVTRKHNKTLLLLLFIVYNFNIFLMAHLLGALSFGFYQFISYPL